MLGYLLFHLRLISKLFVISLKLMWFSSSFFNWLLYKQGTLHFLQNSKFLDSLEGYFECQGLINYEMFLDKNCFSWCKPRGKSLTIFEKKSTSFAWLGSINTPVKPWAPLRAETSRSEMFCQRNVLINFAKLTGKHLCQSLFLIKLQAYSLQLYWKRPPAEVFSCELCNIFQTTSFTEDLRETPSLYICWSSTRNSS